MRLRLMIAAFAAAALLPAAADAQVTRIKSNPQAIILDAARVSAGTEMLFVSGQLASPVDPAKPMAEVKSVDEMGDTKTQTIAALGKIKKILESQGYKMSDTIKLSLFLAPDPKTGRMDFAGANEGFKTFFGTAETPVTVARSTFQVGALVGPYYLIEIEAIAAKLP
ncbi:MAG: endonuclease [Sphingomonadales bacterium]|nr:endonuclease [Sphingomonadales bacterium]